MPVFSLSVGGTIMFVPISLYRNWVDRTIGMSIFRSEKLIWMMRVRRTSDAILRSGGSLRWGNPVTPLGLVYKLYVQFDAFTSREQICQLTADIANLSSSPSRQTYQHRKNSQILLFVKLKIKIYLIVTFVCVACIEETIGVLILTRLSSVEGECWL